MHKRSRLSPSERAAVIQVLNKIENNNIQLDPRIVAHGLRAIDKLGPDQAKDFIEEWRAAIRKVQQNSPTTNRQRATSAFPRLWILLGYLFGKSVRERLYLPHIGELQEDFSEVKGRYRSASSIRWLQFCFAIRTVGVALNCVRHSMVGGAIQAGLLILPKQLGRIIREVFRIS
jgi:hypothetical protein